MSELMPILVFSICVALVIEIRDDHLCISKKKYDKFYTFILILVLSLFCGLRTWYNDTVTYKQMYEQAPLVQNFWTSDDASLAGGYGFGLLNSIMKTLGFSTQDFLMSYAFMTIIPYILFIRKFCPHFTFGIFLMFATGFYTFTFAAIKQCMATGLCLWAVMAAVDRKWGRYILFIFLACLFRPYSIVYLVVPFLIFRPWSSRTYICIIAFIIIGFTLESLLGTILDVTDMIGANYNEESFVGEGVNLFRVLVAFVPLVLSVPYKNFLFYNVGRTEYLMFNMSMIHALLMFVGIFGTANYFARLANYFLPAVVVVLPWMLNKLYDRHQAFLKASCIIGYCGYFYYDNVIARHFDTMFMKIGLWDYITSHF